ncbi:MAG: hypothetical protein WCT11_02235 [Candidatus Magasanikbacteria bacterium]|jgi:mannose-6-phosphate isomerase-like protein (cupin superfamily)
MINKIFRSQFDLANLSLQKSVPIFSDNPDYNGLVVRKPWGYEYLLFENKHVAIWFLYIKNGMKTSMHCHPNKKTSLINLHGKIETSSLTDTFLLSEKEAIMIDNGVFHSTLAISNGGAYVIEIENPPNKGDLIRLRDAYGRENKGYEGVSETTRDLSGFEYHAFAKTDIEKSFKNRIMSLISTTDLACTILHPSDIICPIAHDDNNYSLLGEVLHVGSKLEQDCLSQNSIRFLLIR